MPITETAITTDDIQRVTKELGLYTQTWGGFQNRNTPQRLREVAERHIEHLKSELPDLHVHRFHPVEIEEGRIHVSYYVDVMDYDEPIPLLFYEYDAETGDTRGGDLDLY